MSTSSKYNPREIEPKWQDFWAKNPDLTRILEDSDKKKQYILDMFPYPSGAGLHVGHVESYTATDIYSRYLRMRGYNVLHPQGWDAFGLPAENYAIKTGVHPAKTTEKAIETFKRQIDSMGFSYDWSREISSSSPAYYKWTQWLFLLFYENGLAYKKKAKVNWCPNCQTVLANEQAESGKCERCGTEVTQKDLEQWFFKITDFIEDREDMREGTDVPTEVRTSGLLSGLDKVDWPESTKLLQKNWIGKSEGATIKFKINNLSLNTGVFKDRYLEVFTTRIDTIYGCTYCVIAPEHEIIQKLKDKITNYSEVEKYLEEAKKKTDLDRTSAKEKTGVELKGIKVVNPFTKEALPLWAADYVLSQYGTGAVMAVPAHDERDFEFAKKFNLPIKYVITPSIEYEEYKNHIQSFTRIGVKNASEEKELTDKLILDDIPQALYGYLINSDKYTGLHSINAKEKMTAWLEENNLGSRKINYKLRDWLVSRQRYWGAPIPIIYCEKCGTVPVPEDQLPVELPDDVDFKPTGESPLKFSKKFQKVKCPVCGAPARRESDTMDTFVCSSWYYLRYADPKNEKEFAGKKNIKRWLPVDLYVGGAEHSVLHLLYARFFTKVLHNLGHIDFDEPFSKLRHQGIILAEDGTKMSKSKGNVVKPDDVVAQYGADTLRIFEMFMGPLEDMKPWQTNGLVGAFRFLERVWKLENKLNDKINNDARNSKSQETNLKQTSNSNDQNQKLTILIHKTIKKVSQDIENLKFNTAISSLMILTNEFEKQNELRVIDYELLVTLLSPFAPHLAEELWSKLGHETSIFKESWPEYDPKLIVDEEMELVVQVNGKVRDRIIVPAGISEEEAKKLALKSEKVLAHIQDKEIKKVIFVKGRLINLVI